MNRSPRLWWKTLWPRPSAAARTVRSWSDALVRLELLERRIALSGNPATTPLALAALVAPATSLAVGDSASGALTQGQTDAYTITIADAGRLIASVTTTGTLSPQLILSGPDGRPLVQSNSGRLSQYVEPGTYTLSVEARAGSGSYQLATDFAAANPLGARLAVGSTPYGVAAADLTNDGTPDVVVANQRDSTVSVFVGIGDGYFQSPLTFDVGLLPFAVAVGDVSGDDQLDIVTVDKLDRTVSVLLGNGDGTFQPRTTYDVGIRPGGVTIADLTGDGAPDLVVSNYGGGTVSVLLGNGDGTFQPQQVIESGGSPVKVEVADVTGDGIPDLIVPDYGANTVGVLPGNGDGTFQPQQSFGTGSGPYSAVVGDVSGDGKPDIVTANYGDNSVSVLLGNGDGTFVAAQNFAVGALPYSIALADVNGDGRPDVVTANSGDNTVSVLRGVGDGAFLPQRAFDAGKSPRGVAVGDISGDGTPDILVANRGDDTVSVLLGTGDGSFQSRPSSTAPSLRPVAATVADVNGDGRRDIVTANFGDDSVSVLVRNPNGTFQPRQTFATGTNPAAVAVTDVNGDGTPDLVTANYGGSSVSVLLGNADGTFQPHQDFQVGPSPQTIAVADVSGDGVPDLVVPNKAGNSAIVLLGAGDGTFFPVGDFAAANSTRTVAVADVNDDGVPDLVTAGFSSVAVLLGDGEGGYDAPLVYPTAGNTIALAVADLTGDGVLDIVSANAAGGAVSLLRGTGDGTFVPAGDFEVGAIPYSVTVADLNGDGAPDIIAANAGDATVSVLLGEGAGAFRPQETYGVGFGTSSVVVEDVTGDRRLDLVATNSAQNTVSVLPGNGDGTFGTQDVVAPGTDLYSVAVADITGDGKPDLVTANRRQNSVRVQAGNGDGTFQKGQTLPVGEQPASVLLADLNGDGRLDLVTANAGSDGASVLLGNGDGTFQPQATYATGRSPRTVVTADVNGDGAADLVVSNYNDDTVSVLLGNGDGSFQPQRVLAVGHRPYAVAVADLNSDGLADLAAANTGSDTVSVLFGYGNGTFRHQRTFAVGRQPFALAVADFTGDGRPDLATANFADGTASVLVGRAGGTFQPQAVYAVGISPTAVVAADLVGAGRPALVVTNRGDDTLSVLMTDSTGAFQPARTLDTGAQPLTTAAADVNGDGVPDLATIGNSDGSVGVLLGDGSGDFRPGGTVGGAGPFNAPLLADFTGDGVADSAVLDGAGNILFRRGLAGAANAFAPPVILNSVNRTARALAAVETEAGWAIAAADTTFDPALSSPGQFAYTVSLYTVAASGSVHRATAFTTSMLPTNIAATDLTGDGRADIVVANALNNSVQIALQRPDGTFGSPLTRAVGGAPSGVTFADVNGDGRRDIVVGNQASGTATVLLNDAAHSFDTADTYRAGLGFSVASEGVLTSRDLSVALAAGDFTGTGRNDLVVVNRGAHSFTVLPNDGTGGFTDPLATRTTSTSSNRVINDRAGPVVTADFRGANSQRDADIAVLMEGRDEVWIYSNDGSGTFTLGQQIPVGSRSNGLSVVPGSRPGLFDLLVGNAFGDVLRLVGNGDGTFIPPPPVSGDDVSLDVLMSGGEPVVLVANQRTNAVTVQMPAATGTALGRGVTVATSAPIATAPASPDTLAPGAVYWVQLEGADAPFDAVVVASGSNSVLVYKTLAVNTLTGEPTFAAPVAYPVGTEPVALTVGYFNGSAVPSLLIANKGSNDISVIFGDVSGGTWVGRAGPRLDSGGVGPIAVSLEPMSDGGAPALVVTNAGSGTITALPGIGQGGGTGFFRDNAPVSLAVPATPIGPLIGGFLPTDQGIFRFDATAMSVTQVFATTSLAAISVVGNGWVVAGFDGGALGLLQDVGGALTLAQTFADARLTAVSGLQAVVNVDGAMEIFASSAGTGDTVFEFTVNMADAANPFAFTVQQGIATVFDPTPIAQPTPTIDLESVGASGTFFVAVLSGPGPAVTSEYGSPDRVADSSAEGVSEVATALTAALVGGAGEGEADTPGAEVPEGEPLPLNDFLTGIDDALEAIRKQIREREGVEEKAELPAPKEEKDAAEPPAETDPQASVRGTIGETTDPDPFLLSIAIPDTLPVPHTPRPERDGPVSQPEEPQAVAAEERAEPRDASRLYWLPLLLSCVWLWLENERKLARHRDRYSPHSLSGSPMDTVR